MAFEIVYLPEFDARLEQIISYLKWKWNQQVIDSFLDRLRDVLDILELQPSIYRLTTADEVREVILTSHNILLFRIKGNRVELLSIFDTRQNPDKKFKDL